ncbi:SidA/IucD/PvdA family monooxygenase [Legionella drancourtii]|nr:SidA/IucD/PvdA family monooxygenase [Legionella drancourtii]
MMYCDVFGVGAGPANLSLAALLEKTPDIKAYFCDKKIKYHWHPGMLIPGTKLQVSYLKDLVTLVDPTNKYSFINYLHQSGKLYQFITADFKETSRLEFSQYLEWVFNDLRSVREDETILDISLIQDELAITTTKETYQTKKLVLGSGLVPYIPDYCKDFVNDEVFHSAEYLHKKTDLSNKKVTIIGGGQSGAEILLDSLSKTNGLPLKIYWISKEQNFDAIDDSAFANELFLPSYIKYFYQLPPHLKSSLLEKQRLASDGISNHTIDNIYQKLYELEFIYKKIG